MTLCVTPLPLEYNQELQRLIAGVPDGDLAVLVATEPAFQTGGFRRDSKPAVIRARLHQIVNSTQPISNTVRQTLARRSATAALTSLLSPELLTETRHAMVVLLGKPALLVALLLDARADVRKKAALWLAGQESFIFLSPEVALERLRERFSELTTLLGSQPRAGQPPTREAWRLQKERLEDQLRHLKAEKRRLKGVDDRLARVTTKLTACATDLKQAREQTSVKTSALKERQAELATIRSELKREQTNRDERLCAALDLALATEFHGWLAHTRTLEQAVENEAPTCRDLLQQAELALKRQQETDRNNGNRAVLHARLDQLTAMHTRVRQALCNALHQTPELKRIEPQLAHEIETLSNLLEPQPAVTRLEKALLTHIHKADANTLPDSRNLLERLTPLQVLDASALTRLHQAFHKRLSIVETAVLPPDPRMEARSPAIAQFNRALTGHCPAILLIDGHNLLFGLPTRYNPPRGTSRTEAEKRDLLATDIVNLISPMPSIRAWIVFDGPIRSDTQAAPNVRVSYSGGEGEHRADGVLLNNLRFFKTSSPDTTVFLVSDDCDLCAAARRLGAFDIAVLDLGAFFQQALCPQA